MEINLLKDNLLNFYTIRVIILWIIGLIVMSLNLFNKNLIGMTLMFMLVTISWMGFIIVHIYPKYFYFPVNNYYMRRGELIATDLLLHQLPWFIHLILLRIGFWTFDKTMIPIAIILNLIYLLVYLMQVNPYKIYLHKQ
jgi:hypothetical protein